MAKVGARQGGAHRRDDLAGRGHLGHQASGAALLRLRQPLGVHLGRHQQDRAVGQQGLQLGQVVEPVAIGQLDVEQDQVRGRPQGPGAAQRLRPVTGVPHDRLGPVFGQHHAQPGAKQGMVIHQEKARRRGVHVRNA